MNSISRCVAVLTARSIGLAVAFKECDGVVPARLGHVERPVIYHFAELRRKRVRSASLLFRNILPLDV